MKAILQPLHPGHLYFLLTIILVSSWDNISMAQMAVEDKNNRMQVERMVFMHWKKFRPAWYFWLLHARYKKKDRRTILQLMPALAALEGNRKASRKERKDIKAVHEFKVMQQAATLAEFLYYLYYKKVFSRLDEAYDKLYSLCIRYGAAEGDLSRFEGERAMLSEYVQAVRQGNIMQGESAASMSEIQMDYRKLLSAMYAFICAMQLKNKVSNINIHSQ